MEQLNCITLNVRGLRNKSKRETVFEFLKQKHVNIAFLQETYCTSDFVETFRNNWNGKVFHSCSPSNHSKGVCILIDCKTDCKIISEYHDDEGRKLLVNIEIDNICYTLISVYSPNSKYDRAAFFKSLPAWTLKHCMCKENIICGGDFNCTLKQSDRKNGKKPDTSVNILRKYLSTFDLIDVWRKLNPHAIGFTFIDPSNRGFDSRIDYLFMSGDIYKQTRSCSIIPAPVPDHNAVISNTCLQKNKRGTGYWKMNVSVLEEVEYIKGVNELIDRTVNDYEEVGKKLLWELCKVRIREYTISYCINKKKSKKTKIVQLEQRLKQLEAIDRYEDKEERKNIKQQIESQYLEDAKGAQIRSKAKYVEEGERSTKYFLGLEKKRQSCNTIRCLKSNEQVYTTDEDLLNVAAEFYDNLYATKNVANNDIENYLRHTNINKKLSNLERKSIEGKITFAECGKALKLLKMNKSPGLDGIPSEFYVKFWDKICNVVVGSYNESYEDGQLSESQRSSVISLIFKKGDAQLLCNYRPISLTNCDYKILAFCLANRMQSVIKSIINPSQVAYINGRYIGSNIRLVEDIVEFYDKYERGGIIMMLDFQKAFDSLEWNFLYAVLEQCNFSISFINWIRTLYDDPITCIKNNGYVSRNISIQRGIRQGCPVSALLFIIATEIMAINIRNDSDIQGFNMPGSNENIKILQYADDGVIFLNNLKEMRRAIDVVNTFGKHAGTMLNLSKCEGLWLGSFKDRQVDCNLLGIKWRTEPIRCLGIYIGHDAVKKDELNWYKKLEKIKGLLDSWKKRDLTLFGKITIIKQLAIPKILFSATMLAVPENVVKNLNTLLYEFIWGKKDSIKRNVIINDVKHGGLQMLDVEALFSSVKASWVVRYLNASPDEVWPIVANKYFTLLGDKFLLFKLNCSDAKAFPILKQFPAFYREVYSSYNLSKCVTHEFVIDTILDQPLWGNDYIKCKTIDGNNTALLFKSWIESNLIKVGNLRFINGVLDDQFIFNKVRNHRNIFSEISCLKHALRPFKDQIGNHEPDFNYDLPIFYNKSTKLNEFTSSKSKFFYKNLIKFKVEKPTKQENHWINICNVKDFNFDYVYISQICKVKDRKIAEFNFKVLHNVLSCNANLVKWKKKDIGLCNICGELETIEHLLFNCTFAKRIWIDFNTMVDFIVELTHIIFGVENNDILSFVISLISYLIYKDWLVHSMSNLPRNTNPSLDIFKSDLLYRNRIYEKLGWQNISNVLQLLLRKM